MKINFDKKPYTFFIWLSTIAGLWFIGCLGFAVAQPSIGLEEKLTRTSILSADVVSSTVPWQRHVKQFLLDSRISGGIIENQNPLEKKSVKGSLRGARVSGKQLLDGLSSQNPKYKWKVTGESVNVLPQDISGQPLNLLNERVLHFSVKARFATVAIYQLLMAQQFPVCPEMKYTFGGIKPRNVPNEREFSCVNKTILECMNSFAAEDRSLFWYLYFDKQRKAYIISISDVKETP